MLVARPKKHILIPAVAVLIREKNKRDIRFVLLRFRLNFKMENFLWWKSVEVWPGQGGSNHKEMRIIYNLASTEIPFIEIFISDFMWSSGITAADEVMKWVNNDAIKLHFFDCSKRIDFLSVCNFAAPANACL